MSCSNPITMPMIDRYGIQHYPVDVTGKSISFPCGYCVGCKMDKINLWTRRITYEYTGKTSSFVALTYDDFHLHYNKGYYNPSLDRLELKKFLDNLRHLVHNKYGSADGVNANFKHFAVGEYGGMNNRPHYHLLLLGLSPKFCSVVLPKLWKKGSIRVDPMALGSVRYVLKYMEKQQNKDYYKKHYTCFGLDPPFISCSPGIGAEYIMSHSDDILRTGCIKDGSHFIPVPNYWKNKIFLMSPSNYYIQLQRDYKNKVNSENLKFARDHGYKNFDSYMLEQARLKEVEMVNDMRRNGIPVEDVKTYGHVTYKTPKNFSLVKRSHNLSKLADEALEFHNYDF